MRIQDHQQEDFCSLRLCVLLLSLTQSRRDAKSIVNPGLNVFRVVAHPADHYRLRKINPEILEICVILWFPPQGARACFLIRREVQYQKREERHHKEDHHHLLFLRNHLSALRLQHDEAPELLCPVCVPSGSEQPY